MYLENSIFNFYLSGEVKSSENQHSCDELSAVGKRAWQRSALASPHEHFESRCGTIGSDIELVVLPREDVRMGIDEYEEALEAEIPRVRMKPENPTNREKQEHEDSGHAVCRGWCAACVGGKRSGWTTSI